MQIFEEKIRNALAQHKQIIYQATPVSRGNELMPRGYWSQAISIDGNLNFNVYIWNIEPNIKFKQMSWGRAVWNGHVVNVDGFNNNTHQIHVVDLVFGARWINGATFTSSFNTTGMAVSVG